MIASAVTIIQLTEEPLCIFLTASHFAVPGTAAEQLNKQRTNERLTCFTRTIYGRRDVPRQPTGAERLRASRTITHKFIIYRYTSMCIVYPAEFTMTLRPLPMETRSQKVFFQKDRFQRTAENILVPPLWEKRKQCLLVFFERLQAAIFDFPSCKLSTRL